MGVDFEENKMDTSIVMDFFSLIPPHSTPKGLLSFFLSFFLSLFCDLLLFDSVVETI